MAVFFLMCSERSGSNFITKLLNGHSKICGPSTKHIINPLARNIFRYEPLDDNENWNELLKDIHNLINVNFSVWKKTFSMDDLACLAPVGDVASLIRNIFKEEAKANGKQHVFIKENQVYEFMPFLLLNFSESKYIYQVRDPRDMALSWKKNLNSYGGVVVAARQWKLDQQNTLKNYNELKKRGRAFFVRYEDLITDPIKYIRQILCFIGLSYEETILDFHKDALTKKNAGMQEAWNNLSKGVISNNKEKYLLELAEEEIKAIEKICYEEMIYLGYKPKYTELELNKISDGYLDELEKTEDETLAYARTKGVLDNMEAKKCFYKKQGYL